MNALADNKNIIIEGLHYATLKVIRLGISNGIIYSLADVDSKFWSGENERRQLPVIAPGLVDLQINGFKGIDFNDPELTTGQVESLVPAFFENGVTRFYPTLVTGSKKRTSAILRTLETVMKQKGRASQMIGGIHLEGPFISPEDGPRGAHSKRYCIEPDLNLLHQWQKEANGHIRIITLAPELKGSEDFIRECADLGIIVAIGHTGGKMEDIRMAVKAGARLSTHLGNGSHHVMPRHPNYIWDQLAEDQLYASMIADGFHLPDSVLRVFMRTKGEKAILVSDGMPQTGLEPGVYDTPSTGKIRLTKEGKIHKEGHPDLLAGSAGTLIGNVMKVSRLEGFSKAWEMGSVHPSRLMNHSANHGLYVGATADLVLLDPDFTRLKVDRVLKGGIEYTF